MATTTKKPKAPTLTQRVDELSVAVAQVERNAKFEAVDKYGYRATIRSLELEVGEIRKQLHALENPPSPKYRVEVERARIGRGWCAWIYRPGSSSHVTHTSSSTPERARRKAERWIKKDIKQQAKPADPNVGTFYVDAGSK